MSNCCCDKFVMIEGEEDSFETWQGLRGPYYTPSVSEDGTLSWTNNGDLQNPSDVNIKGPPGPGGVPGGTTGQLLAKASDDDFDTEWIDAPDMDAGGVTYDPTEAYSDGTVGKELGTINSALSSLQSVTEIIDTASGAIASFPDGSGLPMRSLLAQIEPQQEGSGDPSPENVRPISGWTGLSGWVEDEYDPTEQPTFSVSWQSEAGTVYGGTVDVVTGVLTAGWKIVDLATLTWTTTSWGGWRTGSISDLKIIPSTENANLVAEKYKSVSQGNLQQTPNGIATGITTTPQRLYVNATDSPTGMCVYPLAEPIVYQLSGQQIETLIGNNTVFVDCGSVSVTYQASIKGYIDKVLAS